MKCPSCGRNISRYRTRSYGQEKEVFEATCFECEVVFDIRVLRGIPLIECHEQCDACLNCRHHGKCWWSNNRKCMVREAGA